VGSVRPKPIRVVPSNSIFELRERGRVPVAPPNQKSHPQDGAFGFSYETIIIMFTKNKVLMALEEIDRAYEAKDAVELEALHTATIELIAKVLSGSIQLNEYTYLLIEELRGLPDHPYIDELRLQIIELTK
jgi:hypothetical protein